MIGTDHPKGEWRGILVKWDQRLPRIGRERVAEELEAHATASPAKAASSAAMSIFFISIIAAIARAPASRSLLVIISISRRGVICHDRPNLSLHQPHIDSAPPSAM